LRFLLFSAFAFLEAFSAFPSPSSSSSSFFFFYFFFFFPRPSENVVAPLCSARTRRLGAVSLFCFLLVVDLPSPIRVARRPRRRIVIVIVIVIVIFIVVF
jgi:amino acid transporter